MQKATDEQIIEALKGSMGIVSWQGHRQRKEQA